MKISHKKSSKKPVVTQKPVVKEEKIEVVTPVVKTPYKIVKIDLPVEEEEIDE